MHRAARAALVIALLGPACAPPVQSGGVDVRDGAEARLAVACRWRRGDVSRDTCAAPAAPRRARVTTIRGANPLSGSFVAGRAGDYLLENDEIAVVIDRLGPGVGFAESGGNVVDAADAQVRHDELGQLFTYFGAFPRQAVYEHLTTSVTDDGAAVIVVTGHELYEPELAITTRYELGAQSRGLFITTELENRSKRPMPALGLGDAVQWGSAEKVAPGKEPGFSGAYAGPFVAGVGRHVGYALVPLPLEEGGATPQLASRNGTGWSNVTYGEDVALAPGQKARFARALVVAPRGDTAGIVNELAFLSGASPGGVAFELVGDGGKPVVGEPRRVEPGRVVLTSAGGHEPGAREPALGLFLTATAEGFAGEIPPGAYTARYEGPRAPTGGAAPVRVDVKAGAVTKARITVGEPAAILVTVTDGERPIPAKVQLFDAATGAPGRAPMNLITGQARALMPPGRYRVVASRGPEYSLDESTVTLAAGATVDVALAVRRVLDTRGYIGCDLHQHTAWSADSGVTVQERVASNVAEGVGCAVASEHNFVADFSSTVAELGLAPWFRSISGEEITADASRAPFGHANVFPLVAAADQPRNGALAVRDRPVHDVFEEARGRAGRPILQINHPRAGDRTGYFEQLDFDRATGVGRAPAYDAGFDALEVWTGRHVDTRARVLEDLWALLRTGHPVTPTASTDTHGVVGHEAGYPRTFVRVDDDDPAKLTPAMLVEGLRERRDVVLTNGPFVTLRGEVARQGGVEPLTAKAARVTAHVERAPWVDLTNLVVFVGGVASEPIRVGCNTGCLKEHTTAAGAVATDLTIEVRRRADAQKPRVLRRGAALVVETRDDTFIAVAARGERPLTPVLSGEPAEIMPFGLSAPLWIDADGDGSSLGRR